MFVACRVKLFLGGLGKPNQSACIESFSRQPCDELLKERWISALDQNKVIVEALRRESSKERHKAVIYARQLT